MTVDIKNVESGSGWFPYTLIKDGIAREGATLIIGDPILGNKICDSIDYKSGNSVNFVISFAKEDGVSHAQGREIAKEFMESFMEGYQNDEYHLDLVEHTDTDHLHYHARVPKLNLLTNTQLKLYWHKTDLEYKKAVIADICHRYRLTTGEEMKNTMPNPLHKLTQINKWRDQHGQKPLDLKSKKLRAVAEKEIGEYISSMVATGLINSLDDVKAELMEIGFEIGKNDYDRGKEFHYLTVENESGKIRLKGDIYSEEFYRHSQEDRSEAISSNRSFTTRGAELKRSGEDVKQALHTERNKRLKFIEKQYGNARKRAYRREDETSITADRGEDSRGVGQLGDTHGNNTQEDVRSTSSDIERGQGSVQDASIPHGEDERATRGDGKSVGRDEQKENRLHMGMDNTFLGVDVGHDSNRVISHQKPTHIRVREEDKPRRSDAGTSKRVHDRQDGTRRTNTYAQRRKLDDRLYKYRNRARKRGRQTTDNLRTLSDIRLVKDITPMAMLLSYDQLDELRPQTGKHRHMFRATAGDIEAKQRVINDRVRAEIDGTVRDATGSLYTRTTEDINLVRAEHQRSKRRDSEAVTDIETLRGRVHQLADKHRPEAARRMGEQIEQEGAEFDGAIGEAKGCQSSVNKEYEGLEREHNGAVGRIGDKVAELTRAVGQFIEKTIEKVKVNISFNNNKEEESNPSQGFGGGMMPR